jgi:signal transduction histidine kinase
VIDDGKGFTPDLTGTPEPGHLGLTTMVERAELAGGWVRVLSTPGQGTTVECWLPADVTAGDPALSEPGGS